MQMFSICVCDIYADAGHMDMLYISFFLSFLCQIRKKHVPDLLQMHRRAAAAEGHILWQLWLTVGTKHHMLCLFLPLPLRCCTPENAALLISCAWYTSGKS